MTPESAHARTLERTQHVIGTPGGRVKKEDAVNAIDSLGTNIQDLNARVWTTVLNPREHGLGETLLSIAAIPVVNAAFFGHLLTSVVVKEVPASVFDTVSNLGGGKKKEP